MEMLMALKIRNCCSILALTSVICIAFFQGVTCETEANTSYSINVTSVTAPSIQAAAVRGDDVQITQAVIKHQEQLVVFPTFPALGSSSATPSVLQDKTNQESQFTTVPESAGPQDTQAPQYVNTNQPDVGLVVCVDEAAVRGKEAVRLKLKTSSSCEENKAKIQSVLEHLCGDDSKLEIYQQDYTDEMIISGQCIQDSARGMTEKFNNDNIKDKVGVVEATPILVKHSRTVLVSVLLSGLLLAALLIGVYILKTHRTQAKGVCMDEELFQVDEQNQGNTLLSVVPLPPQEPLDKPTSNGESPESLPTNGHSATQTPGADTQM